jgi:hypothetical protein
MPGGILQASGQQVQVLPAFREEDGASAFLKGSPDISDDQVVPEGIRHQCAIEILDGPLAIKPGLPDDEAA